MYRALRREGEQGPLAAAIEDGRAAAQGLADDSLLMTLSLFGSGRNLFLYYECIDAFIEPGKIFPGLGGLLEPRPGEAESRTWIAMADIFHFSTPLSVEHWKRKEAPRERLGMVARIAPGKLGSYIYHHYLLQESQSSIVNKYCMIGLDENLIFYYEEQPVTFELAQSKGALDPSSLGADWQDTWQDLMAPHFEAELSRCEHIISCYQGFDRARGRRYS